MAPFEKNKIKWSDKALNTFTAKTSCALPSGPLDSKPSHICPLWGCDRHSKLPAEPENQDCPPNHQSRTTLHASPTWLAAHCSWKTHNMCPLASASHSALQVLLKTMSSENPYGAAGLWTHGCGQGSQPGCPIEEFGNLTTFLSPTTGQSNLSISELVYVNGLHISLEQKLGCGVGTPNHHTLQGTSIM